MKKVSFILILCLLCSFCTSIVASAKGNEIAPRLNNAGTITCSFDIIDNRAICTATVSGYTSITTNISVKCTLEKRALLGLWWSDVNEWTATSSQVTDTFTFTESVGSGTYRCSFEVTVYGSGGSADVITEEITVKN